MHSLMIPFFVTFAVMSHSVDPERLNAEIAADADVLRSLKENGDDPSIIRPVDVRFLGSPDAVTILQLQVSVQGWQIIQRVRIDDHTDALDLQRKQKTDLRSIRELTKAALQIEARYGVRYDGWGTVATKP